MKQMILLLLTLFIGTACAYAQESAFHPRHERHNSYYHKGHYRHHPHNFGRFHHPHHGRGTTGVEVTMPLPRPRVSAVSSPCHCHKKA